LLQFNYNKPQNSITKGFNVIRKLIPSLFILSLFSVFSVFSEDELTQNSEGMPYPLSTYDVDGNTISNPKNHKVPDKFKEFVGKEEKNKEIWELFINIIPLEIRKYIKEYHVLADGKNDDMAFVERLEEKPKDWAIKVDIVNAYKDNKLKVSQLCERYIHTTGHLLTLNTIEVDFDDSLYSYRNDDSYFDRSEDSKDECFPNYPPEDACAKTNSYLNLFFEQFWADFHEDHQDMVDEFRENAYDKNPDLNEEGVLSAEKKATDLFFIEKRATFVTPHSAKNPEEDIAESWKYFVLLDKPDAPAKDISEEKILFFYEFPELVEYRQQIRDSINTKYASYSILPWTPEEVDLDGD
jgi:hypothetical protein